LLNIIHRPELVPEYLEKTAAQGKAEDVARRGVIDESLGIFALQQKIVHDAGLISTIQMTYSSLHSEAAVAMASHDSQTYGDEIGLTFVGLTCRDFRERFKSREIAIWLFSMEEKKKIVDYMFARFREAFGRYPRSIGAYYMDAALLRYIKRRYPEVTCAVATCWEEGPKAFRNANNSWYTFLDGGPFHPWIPSRRNTHCPASDERDDVGVVAIPHLSRDLLAVFDGPGSFYGTHPQNVLRGMVYRDGELPYLYNLIDQYRTLTRYNKGYSYNMVFVGPGWMSRSGRWEAPYTLLEKSYRDCIAYYGQLKQEGKARDTTMSDFARWFRDHKPYTEPCCALWRDILYGSRKQLFWYVDPYLRAAVDMNQGGALVDLRPYAAKLVRPVGADTKFLADASYPYIIQSFYRAGFFTHYAGEGTIMSCKIGYRGEEVDLCACRTEAEYGEDKNLRVLILKAVEIEFTGLTVSVVTRYRFEEGTGRVFISRTCVKLSDPAARVSCNVYLTGCYGTTEYPEDMSGVILRVRNSRKAKRLVYRYRNRELSLPDARAAEAVIPPVRTLLSLEPGGRGLEGYVREGYGFSPMFTLGCRTELGEGEECGVWLKVQRAR
jgi:hypothetical protein